MSLSPLIQKCKEYCDKKLVENNNNSACIHGGKRIVLQARLNVRWALWFHGAPWAYGAHGSLWANGAPRAYGSMGPYDPMGRYGPMGSMGQWGPMGPWGPMCLWPPWAHWAGHPRPGPAGGLSFLFCCTEAGPT